MLVTDDKPKALAELSIKWECDWKCISMIIRDTDYIQISGDLEAIGNSFD